MKSIAWVLITAAQGGGYALVAVGLSPCGITQNVKDAFGQHMTKDKGRIAEMM